MIIKIKDSDIEYLKTLVRCFNNFTTYVHEGVHITVDPFASVEVHEAAESLVKFRNQCIFPEFFEMLNDIREQINDPVPKTKDLKTTLSSSIHEWFYMRNEELGIIDGPELLDSDISTLEEKLVNECERVLEWQKKSNTKDPKQDMITQWDMILERDCMCNSRDEYLELHPDGDIPVRVDNFYAQIGEAMGPVCYAGYLLMQELKKHNLSTEWVENCITYYQDNWDM